MILVVAGCGRIGFDPFGTPPPIDGTSSEGIGNENTVEAACLTNPAYSARVGLPHRYREGTALISWAAAVAACTVDEAFLWVPNDALEAMSLDGDWVGLTDMASEGTWVTLTGAPAPYLPWDTGQPDGGTDENCARNQDTTYEDRDCMDQRDYVCECE